MSRSLPPLPALGIPGVSTYVERSRGRYRIQFTKDAKRKSITLSSTNPRVAYKEAVEKAEAFDARRYDPWLDELQGLTVLDAIEMYLQSLHNKHLREATIDQREHVLRAWERTLTNDSKISSIKLNDCRNYYEATHRSPASRRTYFNILNTFLNWCLDKFIIISSPLENISRPRVPKGLPAYFTPEQFAKLITTIENDLAAKRQRLTGAALRDLPIDLPDIIRISVETGLRKGELIHQRWLDIDMRSKLLHVRSYRDEKTGASFTVKDNDARVVPLSPDALEIYSRRFNNRKNENDMMIVFPSPKTGRVRDGKSVTRTFSRYVADAGLPKSLKFHSLRHTFASWLASGGTPIVTLQRWMGHAKIETTMIYADLLPSALEWRPSRYHDAARLACYMRADGFQTMPNNADISVSQH